MKAKVYDSGSIKTVLVQDDNGDKFITGLEELLDMLDGDLEWEIETTNESLKSKLYKYAGLMREVGKIRREIESYNTSKVFPVNDFLKDVELQHDKKVIDNYLLGKDLQLEPIPAYSKLPLQDSIKFPASLSQSGSDTIGVQPAPRDYTYDGMRVEIDGITGTVEYTDVHDGLSLRFRGEEAGFLELTPDGIKMPRFEIDDIRMWVHARELTGGTWDVFDGKIGLGAQAETPGEAIKLYLKKLVDNNFVGRGYLNKIGITEDTRMIGNFNKCKNIINIEVVLKYNELLKKDEREDMAMKGGEGEPTLDVLYVTFDVKDIKGNDVPHFMLPSLTGNNHYIVEKEYSRDEIINQALHGGYLTREEMEERGWEGDTPPSFSKDDIDKMVGSFKWMSFNIKVPKDLIVDDHPGE